MALLDELKANTLIRGLFPGNHPVLIVSITIHAGIGAELVYKDSSGQLGKEEDFQLFMALLDQDRFEGRCRDGVHKVDVSDIMRHLVKEQLRKFDGSRLFPERFAYTVNYELSPAENDLYRAVTNYVRQEFNRADALHNNGRKGTIGFALTILQRRLASSPETLYQSLHRRHERLQQRLQETKQTRPHADRQTPVELFQQVPLLEFDDLDDAPTADVELLEERVVDQASAARTIAELEVEIALLAKLEQLAYRWAIIAREARRCRGADDRGGGRIGGGAAASIEACQYGVTSGNGWTSDC